MSNARVQWQGLKELQDALRRMPAEMVKDARPIVEDAANGAERATYSSYPRRTGKLRDGLKVQDISRGPFGVAMLVKNSAKHAWFYDYGTATRHTALGFGRGAMPATHLFGQQMARYRRRMYDELKRMLEGHGMQVRGYP